MQGRLRNEGLSVTVNTECAHCGKAIKLLIDSELNCRVMDERCEPIVFVPDVDLFNLEEESIINAF